MLDHQLVHYTHLAVLAYYSVFPVFGLLAGAAKQVRLYLLLNQSIFVGSG